MKRPFSHSRLRGFTTTEVLVSMAIVTSVLGMAMGAFLFGLRSMARDGRRLEINERLRYITAHLSKRTVGATGFYLLPSYQKLDGSLNLATDVSPDADPSTNAFLFQGDCVILEFRESLAAGATNIERVDIYYRVADPAFATAIGPVRYLSRTFSPARTPAQVAAYLNTLNLSTTPNHPDSVILWDQVVGNRRPAPAIGNFPIFSTTDSNTPSAGNQDLSINIRLLNAETGNVDASSLNFTVSPRGLK